MTVLIIFSLLALLASLVLIIYHARANNWHSGWLGAAFYVIYVIITVAAGLTP